MTLRERAPVTVDLMRNAVTARGRRRAVSVAWPAANLDPGLAVALVDQRGDWARVVASNGWGAWVATAGLVPLAAAQPPLPPPPPPPPALAPAAPGVPAEWAVSEDGLTTAQDAVDPTAEPPAGPRVAATVDPATCSAAPGLSGPSSCTAARSS